MADGVPPLGVGEGTRIHMYIYVDVWAMYFTFRKPLAYRLCYLLILL